MRVLGPQPRLAGEVGAVELGIEIEVESVRGVEELDQGEHARLRPHVLEEEALTPSRVGDDDVGIPAPRPELQRRRGARLPPDHLGFELLRPRMGVAAGAARRLVALYRDAGKPGAVDRERAHFMAGAGKMRREMLELPGKILVDEEQVHRTRGHPAPV